MSALQEQDEVSDAVKIAPESIKTRRVREKLLKQLEKEKSQITSQALLRTREKIQDWIAMNVRHRVSLKGNFKLFDQNQNAAVLSRKVQQIADSLKKSSFLEG